MAFFEGGGLVFCTMIYVAIAPWEKRLGVFHSVWMFFFPGTAANTVKGAPLTVSL